MPEKYFSEALISIWEVLKWNYAIEVNQNWIGGPVLFWYREEGGHLYPVSKASLTAVKANTRKYYLTGKITTTAEKVTVYDEKLVIEFKSGMMVEVDA